MLHASAQASPFSPCPTAVHGKHARAVGDSQEQSCLEYCNAAEPCNTFTQGFPLIAPSCHLAEVAVQQRAGSAPGALACLRVLHAEPLVICFPAVPVCCRAAAGSPAPHCCREGRRPGQAAAASAAAPCKCALRETISNASILPHSRAAGWHENGMARPFPAFQPA